MNPEWWFSFSNYLAMVGWLLMIFAPRWSWSRKIVISGLIPLLLAIVYLVIIVRSFGESSGGFDSLDGVSELFKNPVILLAGWIHYLAFDLFIGSWELSNSQKLGINHFLVIPCMIFTFFFGPIGLLMYFVVRYFKTKDLKTPNF